jgi:beta-lactamase regulating signal transducer with metallopeptidase domain
MIPAIVEAALRALLMAVAVGLCLRLLRVRNVFALKVAWGIVLAASLAMPMLMRWQALPRIATLVMPVPHWWRAEQPISSKPLPGASGTAFTSGTASIAVTGDAPNALQGREAAAHFPAPTIAHRVFNETQSESPSERLSAQHSQPWPTGPIALFSLLYLAICAVLLLRLFWGAATALRVWIASPTVDPAVLPPAARVAASGIGIRSSRAISSPLTIGSGVLLSADFASWDAEKLRIVLAHERSHIRQGDFYLQLLAGLYAAIFWFSPLGWWLKRTLSDLGETISDRAGLREAASRSSYALILFEFALAPRPTLKGVAMARPSRLSQRIEKLLNESTFRQAFAGSLHRILVAALVVPLTLVVGTTLVRVQAGSQPAPKPAALVQPAAQPVSQVQLAAVSVSETAADLINPHPEPAVASGAPAAPEPDERAPAATFERTLSASAQAQFSVATGSGNITLSQGSGSQIHVSARIYVNKEGTIEEAREIAANPPIEQNGDTIRIGDQQNRYHGISIDYTIEAPAEIHLTAATGSGNITDTGVGREAKLTAGSGDVVASGLTGRFAILTGSGNLRVDGVTEGDAKLQTGSGDIEVKNLGGLLNAQTGSGDIKASGAPSSNWRLSAGSGNIVLAAGNAGFNLDASTGSGSIDTAQAAALQGDTNHHHLSGPVNGGGPTVRLETGSGDIRVD